MTRWLRALGAILIVLTGCVPIPVVGSVDWVEVPPALSSPMSAGDQVAIVGDGLSDDREIVSCVRSATAKADASLRMMPPRAFRDAFPWFQQPTAFWTAEQFSASEPAVKAKASELNVRYAVFIRGSTDAFGLDCMMCTATKQTRISGKMFDLEEVRSPGSLDLSVSGIRRSRQGLVPIILITEGPACREYGRQLAAYLTGKAVARSKSTRTQAPDE